MSPRSQPVPAVHAVHAVQADTNTAGPAVGRIDLPAELGLHRGSVEALRSGLVSSVAAIAIAAGLTALMVLVGR